MEFKKIMIIDDSVTSRMIIKRCFLISGLSDSVFIEAEDGLHAASLLEKDKVDLIVTDINMPKMDGNNLIKKLKTKDEIKDIPIIVITSITNKTAEDELLSIGVKGIIKKPVSPEKIIKILGEING